MPLTRRQFAWGAAAGAAGCGRRRAPTANSITILYPHDEMVLGPGMDMPAKFLVFLPLFQWNSRGEVEGRLAEHWEHSPDFRTWTIRLRDGIRWHDGVRVTAHDVKFTLEVQSQWMGASLSDAPFSIRVLDDLTCSITHRRRVWEIFDDWTVCLPKHIGEKFDPKEFYDWDFWTHPVGNGPYRHHRTVAKTLIEFRANPDYYWGKPRIERVVLKLAGDSKATAVPELRSAGVDVN